MSTLENIVRGATVRGILPEGIVTVSDVRWIGTVAIEVTYKDTAGRLGNELLYRDREPTLEVVESGAPWSFDGDASLSGCCRKRTESAWHICSTLCLQCTHL